MKCMIRPFINGDPGFSVCIPVFIQYATDALGIGWTTGNEGVSLSYDDSIHGEGYRLIIAEGRTDVCASSVKGIHNGLADLLGRITAEGEECFAEASDLTDEPDCRYRGMMIDLARQWHPLSYLKRYVDICWENRGSHIQLHFTDSNSFTLPLDSYPDLPTEGRTYTREEIRELVEYADARGIILVPEVDVPGHSAPFFDKYPGLFGSTGVLPACEEVFDALKKIFTEVAGMFPNSPMIHIGGDEANINSWSNCERTQAYMKEHGINDHHEMYAEYIRIVTGFIISLGRTPVVWEGFSKEYNDRIDRRTIVTVFENLYQPAYDLAEAGFTMINCSWKPLYIVTPTRYWTPEEIGAFDPWKWESPFEKSFAYKDGFRIDSSYPVIGEQICAWGDVIAQWENWEDGIRLEQELVAERMEVLCRKLWDLGMQRHS